MHVVLVLLLLVVAVLVAGCGDEPDGPTGADATLRIALDFTPNATHAPIFAARDQDFDTREGLRIAVQPPGREPDSVEAVLSGRADVGVLDIHDLAIARERGADIVAFAALVSRPLAALITQPGITRPRQLRGERVGVSGLPSDAALLDAVITADGGDPRTVERVTIGFDGVRALLSKRVAAVPMFWNIEGVLLARLGVRVNQLRVDDYGAPPYPELVLFATRATVEGRRDELRRLVRALGSGARASLRRPREVAGVIATAAGSDDVGLVEAQVRALRDVVDTRLSFDLPVLNRWAAFDVRLGLLKRRPEVDRAFETDLAGPRPTG